MAIKVLLADDHRLILEGIRQALSQSDDVEVVGEARTGAQVLPLVRQTKPDVVLLDVRMPEMDGLSVLELLARQHPETKAVILSVSSDPEHIRAALTRGACGYIVKSINPADLPSAVRQAVEGTVYNVLGLPDQAERNDAGDRVGLTDRERSILQALARGLSNRAIAKELWVTEQTVKFHLTNVYRKLDVRNRTEAARAAYRLGLVDSPMLDARDDMTATLVGGS